MRPRQHARVFLLAVACIACRPASPPDNKPLKAIEERLSAAEVRLEDLQAQLNETKGQIFWTKRRLERNDYALFTPGTTGYSRVDTTAGNFLVVMSDFKLYANGYRMIVQIGNPNSADYADARLTVKWAKPFDAKIDSYDAWEKSFHETTVTVGLITRGAWTRTPVILSPATAEETGNIRISMETNKVLLFTPSRSR